ncbi:Malate-2H(+)/Na(+)-lactate antiporter [Serratia fonticola]|uniref:Malate-2H(+)/Na(+)-lactate antiporter n=1 Tax=Serratia fonticola TaxID=47917 RepID=A0A4U9VV13_SERFO|nr:Malate-2H(+)/Na(+)-lactate antiporter [Serratia fonticola]
MVYYGIIFDHPQLVLSDSLFGLRWRFFKYWQFLDHGGHLGSRIGRAGQYAGVITRNYGWAVISGAYVGDKISPLSESTVLARSA